MYAWIWRRLPFGVPGKLAGSVLLATATIALLWYVLFPWAEPLLPFDDVQVTQDAGVPGEPAAPGGEPAAPGGETATPGGDAGVESPSTDDHDLPYDTESNNPVPTSSGR